MSDRTRDDTVGAAAEVGEGAEVGAQAVDVRVRPHGPVVVRAGVPVVQVDPVRAADGVEGWGRPREVPVDARRGDVALCRCGTTASAPVCDRSHRSVEAARGRSGCAASHGVDDAGLRAAAPRCPAGGVLVTAGHVLLAAGLRVRFADGSVGRSGAGGLLCPCGDHLVAFGDGALGS